MKQKTRKNYNKKVIFMTAIGSAFHFDDNTITGIKNLINEQQPSKINVFANSNFQFLRNVATTRNNYQTKLQNLVEIDLIIHQSQQLSTPKLQS
ncbi:MAG: hypothetical protein ACPHVL_06335 [Psychroflexus salarius]|jgi:hypothetical protein